MNCVTDAGSTDQVSASEQLGQLIGLGSNQPVENLGAFHGSPRCGARSMADWQMSPIAAHGSVAVLSQDLDHALPEQINLGQDPCERIAQGL